MKLSLCFIMENLAEKAKNSGSMVALFIPEKIGKRLQARFSEVKGDMVKSRDMHVTIGLVRNGMGREEKIGKILRHVAEQFKPLQCSIDSFGLFEPHEGNDHSWVLYAKPSIDEIKDLHQVCLKEMKKRNIKIDNGDFDFSPHITLKYCKDKPEVDQDENLSFIIDEISYAAGDKRRGFRLG